MLSLFVQTTTTMSFNKIPVIDLLLAFDPATKDTFISDLRYALIEVGFLVLTNYELVGPSIDDLNHIKHQSFEFFNLPQLVKDDCSMIKSPHFLGYTKLGDEITNLKTDWREQIDLANELPAPSPEEPIYRNLKGPNLWPDEQYIPKFKPAVNNFIDKMTKLTTVFRHLMADALGIPRQDLDKYFKPNQQTKMKLIAYPDILQLDNVESKIIENDNSLSGQGCGPHRDSDFITFIYQATDHVNSLQVQNFAGEWLSVPTIPNSLVVNGGQTLEAITQGVCKATIHRVMIPEAGSGTRVSIPFFQTIDLDAYKKDLGNIPSQVLEMRDERDIKLSQWSKDAGFQFTPQLDHPIGHFVFRNRIKSHQNVAEKWYPDILKEVMEQYEH